MNINNSNNTSLNEIAQLPITPKAAIHNDQKTLSKSITQKMEIAPIQGEKGKAKLAKSTKEQKFEGNSKIKSLIKFFSKNDKPVSNQIVAEQRERSEAHPLWFTQVSPGILSFLNPEDLAKLSQVSHQFNEEYSKEALWAPHITNYVDLEGNVVPLDPNTSSRQLYSDMSKNNETMFRILSQGGLKEITLFQVKKYEGSDKKRREYEENVCIEAVRLQKGVSDSAAIAKLSDLLKNHPAIAHIKTEDSNKGRLMHVRIKGDQHLQQARKNLCKDLHLAIKDIEGPKITKEKRSWAINPRSLLFQFDLRFNK